MQFFLDDYPLVPVAVDEVLPDEGWYWDVSEGEPFCTAFCVGVWFVGDLLDFVLGFGVLADDLLLVVEFVF